MTLSEWVDRDDIKFKDENAKAAYRRKARRIRDLIELRVPDKVPLWFQDMGYFPCKYAGITFRTGAYDPGAWFQANKQVLVDFDVDTFFNPAYTIRASGQAYEALDTRNVKWPGHGIPDNAGHQHVEGEYMKSEEYDAFITDMTDYVWRVFLPRIHGALEPLATLPPLASLGMGLPAIARIFHTPLVQAALLAVNRAGTESVKWGAASTAFIEEMAGLGFPLLIGAASLAPFDVISDFFRGMRGSMLDMYRCPDKLLAAMDRVLPIYIESAVALAKMTGNPGVYIALHRGADNFMSRKQFEKFYWPGFQKLVLSLIEKELVPCIFLEGDCTSRLEFFSTLPKGKTLAFFENTDARQIKNVLGKTIAIAGGMPLSTLQVGTPDQVRAKTKELIEIVAEGGGYMMGPRSIMDEASIDLVRVWADSTREYGVYNKTIP